MNPGIDTLLGEFENILSILQSHSGEVKKDILPSVPEIRKESSARDKGDALSAVLEDLSSLDPADALSDGDLNRLTGFFCLLYGGDSEFRHMYSQVCEVMFGFLDCGNEDRDPVNGVPFKLVNLSNNLKIVVDAVDGRCEDQRVKRSVEKLYDHVELERIRLSHSAKVEKKLAEAANKNESLADEYERKIGTVESKMRDKLDKELKSAQRETVTVLGIFASIVIAFNAGIAFATSSIEPVSASGAFTIAFIVSIVGLVIFNALFAMFTFVGRVARGVEEPQSKKYWILFALSNIAILICVVVFGVIVLSFPA